MMFSASAGAGRPTFGVVGACGPSTFCPALAAGMARSPVRAARTPVRRMKQVRLMSIVSPPVNLDQRNDVRWPWALEDLATYCAISIGSRVGTRDDGDKESAGRAHVQEVRQHRTGARRGLVGRGAPVPSICTLPNRSIIHSHHQGRCPPRAAAPAPGPGKAPGSRPCLGAPSRATDSGRCDATRECDRVLLLLRVRESHEVVQASRCTRVSH